jgi:hypothetical protein
MSRRRDELERLSQAAAEFLATTARGHGEIARVALSTTTLVDGEFAAAVDVQLQVDDPVTAVAEYAAAFGVAVRFEDSRTDAETVWVCAIGTVAGQLVKVWDAIPRAQAHRLAIHWGQTPALSEMDSRTVLDTPAEVRGWAA